MKKLLNIKDEAKVVRLVGSNNHLCELLFREENNEQTFITPFTETFAKAYLEMFFFLMDAFLMRENSLVIRFLIS